MPFASVLAFWGVSALFVMTPGADWAYAIAAGIRRRTVPAVIGLLSGHVLATLVVAAGVGALIGSVPVLLGVLTATGALYLVWLGIATLRHPPVAVEEGRAAASDRWLLRGFGISGLNPKVLLLFVALLPQFTNSSAAWPLAVQIGVLGALHVVSCAVVYTAVSAGSRVVLASRPAAARAVGLVSGGVMVCLGTLLLAERVLVIVSA